MKKERKSKREKKEKVAGDKVAFNALLIVNWGTVTVNVTLTVTATVELRSAAEQVKAKVIQLYIE